MTYFYLVNFVDVWVLMTCSVRILRILRLNLRIISMVYNSIYYPLSTVHFLLSKFLRIRSSEIECEGDFSSLSWYIIMYLSIPCLTPRECRKFDKSSCQMPHRWGLVGCLIPTMSCRQTLVEDLIAHFN